MEPEDKNQTINQKIGEKMNRILQRNQVFPSNPVLFVNSEGCVNLSVEEQVGGAENGMSVMMLDPLISNDVGRNGGMDVEVVSRDVEENRLLMGEENIYTSGESLLKLAIIRWDIKGTQEAI